MGKKIIITEEQFRQILNEELGIAKVVTDASRELKNELFKRINYSNSGEFEFHDINVKYNVYSFVDDEEFLMWYDTNYDQYVNGYSFVNKTLTLTIIKIGVDYNVASLNDTIQHELEHYYQTKMAGHDFSNDSYNNAYSKLEDYNAYIQNVSIIEYYSSHVEIDAFVNGAYAAAQNMNILDYESFINHTDLKFVKDKLKNAYTFFEKAEFHGIFFNEMLEFIKRNGYYTNCNDVKKLRKEICQRCQNAYTYFVRKTSRAFALIQNEKNERIALQSKNNVRKLMHYKKHE